MRSKYSIQEKLDMIMECRNSGLSDYQWCKENGISTSTFYGWLMQVRNHNGNIPEPSGKDTYISNDKPDIVRLDIVENQASSYISSSTGNGSYHAIEITLGKAVIKISNDISPLLLSNIMSFLGERLC